MADSLTCTGGGERDVGGRKSRPRPARQPGLSYGLGPLIVALLISTAVTPAVAGGHVPSPTPRPTTGEETSTPTPTPTGICDLPIPVPQIAPNPVHSGELVALDGSASTGTFSVFRWGQLAGPRVMIADAQSLTASFVAPPVVEPTVVTMQLALTSPCTPTILVAQADVTILRPAQIALIAVEDATLAPGEQATLDVRLYSDLPTVRIEHDLALDPGVAIVAAADGHPQCSAAPELGATQAEFEFLPAGCSADGCTGIDVAIVAADAIADGALLYRCAIAASGSSPSSCAYPYDCCQRPLGCDAASAYDAAGTAEPAQCVEGIVRIAYPDASAEFLFTIDPPEPRVGDRVQITVDTVPNSPGLIGMPTYGLQGTQPFFSGDVSPRHSTGPRQVTYDLQAVQAGTAELSMSITFETRLGCPGNEFYSFDGIGSQIIPVTVAPASSCAGDCNGDGVVVVNELIMGVNLALNGDPQGVCPALNCSSDPLVSIDCLIGAVRNALYGCPG